MTTRVARAKSSDLVRTDRKRSMPNYRRPITPVPIARIRFSNAHLRSTQPADRRAPLQWRHDRSNSQATSMDYVDSPVRRNCSCRLGAVRDSIAGDSLNPRANREKPCFNTDTTRSSDFGNSSRRASNSRPRSNSSRISTNVCAQRVASLSATSGQTCAAGQARISRN